MIQKIKKLRVSLDGITQFTQSLEAKSRELSLTVTSLQLSKMWLGKVLKELGNTNPYPESKSPFKYRTSSIIQSTHGDIPQGTESIRVNGNEAIFLIDGTEVTFIMDKDTLNGYFEAVPNEKIEPTADKALFRPEVESDWIGFPTAWWKDATHIQKVKWLHVEIEKVEVELREIGRTTTRRSWIAEHLLSSINYTIEAGMWLGVELGNIRDIELARNEVKDIPSHLNSFPLTPEQSFKKE